MTKDDASGISQSRPQTRYHPPCRTVPRRGQDFLQLPLLDVFVHLGGKPAESELRQSPRRGASEVSCMLYVCSQHRALMNHFDAASSLPNSHKVPADLRRRMYCAEEISGLQVHSTHLPSR